MSDAILVRGSDSDWGKIAGRAAGVLLLGVGAVFYFAMELPAPAIVAAVVGGVLWLGTDFYSIHKNRRKRWIIDAGDGFVVTDRAGERPYRDDQLMAIAIAKQENYSGGVLKSVRYRVLLWLAGELDPTELDTVAPVDASDPLAPLLGRWVENLTTRTRAAIGQGGVLDGDRWSLRSDRLSLTSGPAPVEVPLAEVVEMGFFGGKLCLWRRGEEQAFVKLDPDGRNVPVLTAIVGDLLETRPEAEEETADRQLGDSAASEGPGLGRVLFERCSDVPRDFTIILAAAAAVGGLILIFNSAVLGAGLLLVAVVLGLVAWRVPPSIFRCHANGVFQSGPTGTRQLQYSEVDSFTYKAVRQYVNGAYTGTTLALKLVGPGATIDYNKSVKNIDDDLDNLRDHIARVIAVRMSQQLSQQQPVVWTPNMTLRPEGIEFTPHGFLGRKESQFVPYDQLKSFDVQAGVFHLWTEVGKKSAMQEQVSAANFFPGLFLFTSMIASDDDQ